MRTLQRSEFGFEYTCSYITHTWCVGTRRKKL